MTTQPSDWAVAQCPFCGGDAQANDVSPYFWTVSCSACETEGPPFPSKEEAIEHWNHRAPVARELDASGGVSPLSDIIASMRNFADVADEVTVNNAPTAIRHWADMLDATPRAAEAGDDTRRLDFIERTYSGMTNRERYLPVVMIWGKGANGRTLREAIDKYMAKETPFTGVTFVERDMPPGVIAEVRTRHDRVTIVESDDDAAMGAVGAGGGE